MLRANLISSSYYICLVLFILLIIAISCNFKRCLYLFSGINKRVRVALLILLTFSLFMRLYVIEHKHYVFYDEYDHMNIAKNMKEAKQFTYCDFYLDNKCLKAPLPHWPPGYHFLLASLFKFLGTSESVAYNFNAFLGTISVFILFLVTYLITSKNILSLISASLLSFTPLHLMYSGNSSVEMCSLVFILLSVFSLLVFIRLQTKAAILQMLTVVAYTIILRAENGIIIILFPLLIFLNKINLRKFVKESYLLILLLPYFFYLPHIRAYAVSHWLKNQEGVPVIGLLLRNLGFWLSNDLVPYTYSLLALLGVYFSIKMKRKFYLSLILYFVIFLSIFTFIHHARIDVGDNRRYNLLFYFPVVIFAAIGIYEGSRLLSNHLKIKFVVIGILFCALLLNFTNTYRSSQYSRFNGNDRLFQKQYKQFLNGREIDPGCVFIAYNPSPVITIIGSSSVNIAHLFNGKFYDNLLKNRRLVLVDDFWCQQDRDGMCSALKNKYEVEKIESKHNADLGIFYYLKVKK